MLNKVQLFQLLVIQKTKIMQFHENRHTQNIIHLQQLL